MRFSYSFNFTPMRNEVGGYMFYITRNTWEDEFCKDSTTMAQVPIHGLNETHDPERFLEYAVAMVDTAYAETCQAYARSRVVTFTETNARPSDTTTP